MQEGSISQTFLECLDNYRRNATLYKVFQAWKFYKYHTKKEQKMHIVALEYWTYHTMFKCFHVLKEYGCIPDRLRDMSYSKGKYLVYLAVATLLPKNSTILLKSKMDKLINALIESGKIKMNLRKIRRFIKSWEQYLKGQYFYLLRRRWMIIKKFKLKREENIKRKYFAQLAKLNYAKRTLAQLKRVIKKRYFKRWSANALEVRLVQMKHEIAFKEMKKNYLAKCFYALKDYAQWRHRHNDNNMKAIGFFCLKRMYTLFQLWKNNTIVQKYTKENLAASSAYYRYKLYKLSFLVLKRFTQKMSNLRKTKEKYENDRLLVLRHNYLNIWRTALRNKRKIDQFVKKSLLSKYFRTLKNNYLEARKMAATTEGFITKNHSKWLEKCFGNWKAYTQVRKNIKNKIENFQKAHSSAQVKESFLKWRDTFVMNRTLNAKSNIAVTRYQSINIRHCFNSWKEHLNKRKMKAIADSSHENNLMTKAWKGLKQHWYNRMRKNTKLFKASVYYDNKLILSAWNSLKWALNLYKEKMEKVGQYTTQLIYARYFIAFVHFAKQRREHRAIIKRFHENRLIRNFRNAFYYLKYRSKQNRVKRKLRALAIITRQTQLYTKVFKVLKKKFIDRKKGQKLAMRHNQRELRASYNTWKSAFKLENVIKKFIRRKMAIKQRKIFKFWRKYAERKHSINSRCNKFIQKRTEKYLLFSFLLWKKLVLVKQQSHNLAEDLILKHFVNLQIRLLKEWRTYAHKQRLLKTLKAQFQEEAPQRQLTRYMKKWIKKSEKIRKIVLALKTRKAELMKNKLARIFFAWCKKCRGKAIRKRLYAVWEEKKTTHLVLKCLRGWNNYVNKKRVESELVALKRKKATKKLMKKGFIILKLYRDSNVEEKAKLARIRNNHNENVLRKFFVEWCEALKDQIYETKVEPLVDRYRKIVAFRLFRNKLEEFKEEIFYYRTLDNFASEVFKKRAFLTFVERLAEKRINRITLEHKQNALALRIKQRRFQEFKGSLEPSVERTHRDMDAVRTYVLKLYKKSFGVWKSYAYCKVDTARKAKEIKDKVLMNLKKKFIKNLSNLVQESHRSQMKSRRLRSNKDAELAKKSLLGWRKVVVHKKQLQLLSDRYSESSREEIQRNIFRHWYEKVTINMRNKYLLGRVLISVYLNSIQGAFNLIKQQALINDRRERRFDQIHERYVANLLKKSFDQWREIFTSRRFSDDRLHRFF